MAFNRYQPDEGLFLGGWKGFLTECGWGAEKIESNLWKQDRF